MGSNISTLLMIIVRYLISNSGLITALVGAGFIPSDIDTMVTQLTVIIVGLTIQFGPPVWAWFNRPSEKAMEVARAVDKQIPAKDDVEIVTEGNKPNIVVLADKKL